MWPFVFVSIAALAAEFSPIHCWPTRTRDWPLNAAVEVVRLESGDYELHVSRDHAGDTEREELWAMMRAGGGPEQVFLADGVSLRLERREGERAGKFRSRFGEQDVTCR